MNKVVLMGRLTKDPETRYTQGENPMAIARYTLAVDRRNARRGDNNGEQTADFISCVAFGRAGEFVDKNLHKGSKVCVFGRIQTGSYTNKEGQKVYTTEVVAEEHEFAESRSAQSNNQANGGGNNNRYSSPAPAPAPAPMPVPEIPAEVYNGGFTPIDDLDEELPFT